MWRNHGANIKTDSLYYTFIYGMYLYYYYLLSFLSSFFKHVLFMYFKCNVLCLRADKTDPLQWENNSCQSQSGIKWKYVQREMPTVAHFFCFVFTGFFFLLWKCNLALPHPAAASLLNSSKKFQCHKLYCHPMQEIHYSKHETRRT